MHLDTPFFRQNQRTAAQPPTQSPVRIVASNDNRQPLSAPTLDAADIFHRVVSAYGRAQMQPVATLLARELLETLSAELSERSSLGHVLHSHSLHLDTMAALAPPDPDSRRLDIRFEYRMIVALRDAQGRLLAGDPARPQAFAEIWTFERARGSGDWHVVAMCEDEC